MLKKMLFSFNVNFYFQVRIFGHDLPFTTQFLKKIIKNVNNHKWIKSKHLDTEHIKYNNRHYKILQNKGTCKQFLFPNTIEYNDVNMAFK